MGAGDASNPNHQNALSPISPSVASGPLWLWLVSDDSVVSTTGRYLNAGLHRPRGQRLPKHRDECRLGLMQQRIRQSPG